MKESTEESLALLCLFFTPGIGAVSQRRILEKAGSALSLLESPEKISLEGVPEKTLSSIRENSVLERAQKELRWLQEHDSRVISLLSPDYPPLMKTIHDPPAIVFCRGAFRDWPERIPVAFVGTRKASDYGRKVVESLIESLSPYPVVIVSGFAKGVDTYAHETSLRVGVPTVGVLGTGLDYIYPQENEDLYYEMLKTGGFITQFPTGTNPDPWNFPKRNQLIAGVSKGVLVIEAPEKSGALLTADFAMEEGREVMAVPGNVLTLKSRGCHRLIQQGAKLIERVEDLLEELKMGISPDVGARSPRPGGEVPPLQAALLLLDSTEEKLLKNIGNDPLHIDKITEISNLPPSSVAGGLTQLALKGLIEELPGKFFVRSY